MRNLLTITLLLLLMAAWTPPMPAVAHGDACGSQFFDAPDRGFTFDFHNACHGHDDCYGAIRPFSEASRRACDVTFLNTMLDSCSGLWDRDTLKAVPCRTVAAFYYTVVRAAASFVF
jgi:hypothetical protein